MRKLRLFTQPTTIADNEIMRNLDEAYDQMAIRDAIRSKRIHRARSRYLRHAT